MYGSTEACHIRVSVEDCKIVTYRTRQVHTDVKFNILHLGKFGQSKAACACAITISSDRQEELRYTEKINTGIRQGTRQVGNVQQKI